MTGEDLVAIENRNKQREQLRNGAEMAPWVVDQGPGYCYIMGDAGCVAEINPWSQVPNPCVSDIAAFIAHARGDSVEGDVGALVAEVRRLRRIVDEVTPIIIAARGVVPE